MTYRDRRDGDRRKLLALPVDQFISRFLSHVLPDGFMRIRNYGFMANRCRKRNLKMIRKLIGANANFNSQNKTNPILAWLEELVGADKNNCPCCGESLIETTLPSQISRGLGIRTFPHPLHGKSLLQNRGPPQ